MGEEVVVEKESFLKRFWWVVLIAIIVVGLLVTWVVMSFIIHPREKVSDQKDEQKTEQQASGNDWYQNTNYEDVDPNNLPKFITADFIDLSKVFGISKFRSGSGHDFKDDTLTTCASMKHYYGPQAGAETHKDPTTGVTPPPDGVTDTNIFSPVDGTIVYIAEERTPIGRQIFIRPDSNTGFTIRLFHIYLEKGLDVNSKVKSGQKIGVIGKYATTDISVEYTVKGNKSARYVSYFSVMQDSVFANYIARGAKTRDDFIITQTYREAHPLQCENEQAGGNFINHQGDSAEDYVYLSGYSQIKKSN